MSELVAALRRHGVPDADDSSLVRAMYSTDASLYRVVPTVVVRPRHVDEISATLAVAREHGVPVTMRGAGTSIAGNAVGTGIVVDTSHYLNRVLEVDPDGRTALVEPGAVHATLQTRALAQGLRFGPDPSTHSRCTIGGMIGNNACGSRALGYGRTVDNVVSLDVLTGTGERLSLGPEASGNASEVAKRLAAVVDSDLGTVRTEFGRFGRQVSGYSLEHLLPENGRRLDHLLVGSEGTLALVLGARVRLVEDAPHRGLAVLGYPSMVEAADDVPALLHHALVACEGLDERIVGVVASRRGASAVPPLPRGAGWLFAEVTGATEEEVRAAASAVAADSGAVDHRVVTGLAEQAALWRIREDGAGLAARSLERPAHAGWEDAAVPPERLGDYLRGFDALLKEYSYDGVPYGHFGEGCVHVRIDFELDGSDAGRGRFRTFLEDAAVLVASHGGTLSGEHGDGRARSELLAAMYSPAALALFGEVKEVLDPDNLLNPGVLVEPRPVDADLRLATRMREPRTSLRLVEDRGSMLSAVHRCTGVGRCIADNTGTGGVMCPSYVATRNEKDSTRGRARVLQEMANGEVVRDGWRSPEVHEALDLCLACKGCSKDCPTGVDMATYKAEALHQTYRGRLRPRSHYALGRLPTWARLARPVVPVANRALRLSLVQRAAKAAAGIDQRRGVPAFAARPFSRWARGRGAVVERPDVVVWADSFTEHFATGPGQAAVALLERAGLSVAVVGEDACCGLTWISTGQLDAARRIVGRTVDVLHPYVAAGVPIVGLEPSCTAALRSELEQLTDDPRGAELARGVRTLAEYLESLPGWSPPDLGGTTVVAQPHCHHASVLGWEADARLLARAGAAVTRVGGCCGLAGNFGVEKGHYEVSVAIAEHSLLPAVRAAGPDAVVLADGFSCRTQLDDLAGVPAVHMAELLLGSGSP
ncbi:MAG TPA: FAD-binding and (Fe-S)-binding domain-containing protein [Nocardioidaceae bacterium]|nr:FAD-binding and (Fe-S)-binding domain-containing protein [Nocardioidaceae bacterium]